MNLVKQISDQLSSDVLGQLGSLLGADTDTMQRATTAAVPSLLSMLSGMASTDTGAKKLTDMLGGLDLGSLANFAKLLGGANANSVLNTGNSQLSSLFGDSMVSGLANTLSRFTGLNPGMVKSLLAYILPLVLGQVGTLWKSQGGTASALTSLFHSQRDNISNAVPAGFSLADLPGLRDVKDTGYSAARRAHPEPAASGSAARWLLPLALAAIAALFLWRVSQQREVAQNAEQAVEEAHRVGQDIAEKSERMVDDAQRTAHEALERAREDVQALRPELPDLDMPNFKEIFTNIDGDVKDHFDGLFKSVETALDSITDAASADLALPAIQEVHKKITAMNDTMARLPETARTALKPMIEEHVKTVTEKGKLVGDIEGVGDNIKILIHEILTSIANWISPNPS